MHVDFQLFLIAGVILTGLVSFIDKFLLSPKRLGVARLPLIVEYSRSFFPVLLVVFLLRSFLFEPFRIPSGSLLPTLQIGDFILVNKFDYGLRMPILGTKLLSLGKPKRGDIAVFRYPGDTSIDYIKRVVGVPGDRISYINKILYLNGQQVTQQFDSYKTDDESGLSVTVEMKQENLNGIVHNLYINPKMPARDFADVLVPPDHYFVMGDNRDNSNDSRFWGFVPDKNLVGKAVAIWMSWNANQYGIRWGRIGKLIN